MRDPLDELPDWFLIATLPITIPVAAWQYLSDRTPRWERRLIAFWLTVIAAIFLLDLVILRRIGIF